MPNSSQLVLPTIVAPPFNSKSTTVASNGDVKSCSIREEHVVGMSAVHMLSLMATEILLKGALRTGFVSIASYTSAFTLGFLASTTDFHDSLRVKPVLANISREFGRAGRSLALIILPVVEEKSSVGTDAHEHERSEISESANLAHFLYPYPQHFLALYIIQKL